MTKPDNTGENSPGSDEPKVELTWRGIVDADEHAEPRRTSATGAAGRLVGAAGGAAAGMRARAAAASAGPPGRNAKIVKILLVVGVLVYLVVSTSHITQPGTVTLPINLGAAGEPFGPGLHFTLPYPLATTVDLSTQTANYTMTGDGGDDKNTDTFVSVLGSDGAKANVDATLLYRINPAEVRKLYELVGTDFNAKVVRPSARSCVRTAFTKLPLVKASTDGWDSVTDDIRVCIKQAIEPSGLELLDFQLREIKLSDSLQQATDDRAAAEQNAKKQEFEQVTAERKAEIARVQAKATADAQQILACGATVTKTDSGGDAKEFVVPNPTTECKPAPLTDEVLQYAYIQALKDIVGSDGTSTVILPPGGDLNTLLGIGGAGGTTVNGNGAGNGNGNGGNGNAGNGTPAGGETGGAPANP